MNNKKKILAIVLVIVVLLLGGASIYVATQLSTRQAVAPTAPESKPSAADCTSLTTLTACNAQAAPDCSWYATCNKCAPAGALEVDVCPEWVGSTVCTTTATATAVTDCSVKYFCNTTSYTCQATTNTYENTAPYISCDSTLTPKPNCAAALANDTANPDTGVCYMTQALCDASCTAPVTEKPVLTGEKTAYKNVTANTPGKYTLTTLMETVSKSQIYVYSIALTNTSEATATGVVIKDSLKTIPNLTYMDTVTGCSWSAANVELTCNTTIQPDETKTFSFRVKASEAVANGDVISNTAKVTYTDGDAFDLTKDLTVSTLVGCNHSCTTNDECSSGLTCDSATSKCRLVACVAEEDCTCGVTVTQAAAIPTATRTIAPTRAATATVAAEPTPETLTDAGILDFPGIAAFGGGLLLAVVGILLAL